MDINEIIRQVTYHISMDIWDVKGLSEDFFIKRKDKLIRHCPRKDGLGQTTIDINPVFGEMEIHLQTNKLTRYTNLNLYAYNEYPENTFVPEYVRQLTTFLNTCCKPGHHRVRLDFIRVESILIELEYNNEIQNIMDYFTNHPNCAEIVTNFERLTGFITSKYKNKNGFEFFLEIGSWRGTEIWIHNQGGEVEIKAGSVQNIVLILLHFFESLKKMRQRFEFQNIKKIQY